MFRRAAHRWVDSTVVSGRDVPISVALFCVNVGFGKRHSLLVFAEF